MAHEAYTREREQEMSEREDAHVLQHYIPRPTRDISKSCTVA